MKLGDQKICFELPLFYYVPQLSYARELREKRALRECLSFYKTVERIKNERIARASLKNTFKFIADFIFSLRVHSVRNKK